MYMSLAGIIKDLGHTVTSQHVIDPKTTEGEWIHDYKPDQLWKREIDRLQDSDVLISEVTTPSFGVAFMMDEAMKLKKPQLSLYYALPFQQDDLPLMLRGKPDINFRIYTEENARAVLHDFFQTLK